MNDFDLSNDEKKQLIQTVWTIMEGFVDRALGDDPVQSALAEQTSKRALDSGPMIDLEKVADNVFKEQPIANEREET